MEKKAVSYRALYSDNEDFRAYVDRNAKSYNRPVAEILELRIIKDYGDYILSRGASEKSQMPSVSTVDCGCC